MFSGRHELKKDDTGKIFLDRDGKTFEHIISYLRNNLRIAQFDSSFQKEQFELELRYWKLPVNVTVYKDVRTKEFQDLQVMMNTCPITKSEKALKKWKEAGPI